MKKGLTLVGLITVIGILGLLACLFLGGCDYQTNDQSDREVARETERAMQEAHAQAGLPAIVNYQEKKLAKMIYELRDQENLVCYAYLKSLEGKPVFIGKCIGFGLPYCVQYSNPEKIVDYAGRKMDYQFGTIPQPEPNGLFMPQSLSATWLMMVDPETGDARPVYIEPEIIVSPFKLSV